MAKVERIREVVTGSVDLEYVRQKTEAGWKLVAMEWRREIAGDETEQPIIVEDIPYGLRVASDCSRLEEDPEETNSSGADDGFDRPGLFHHPGGI